jgi:hypothetical protein
MIKRRVAVTNDSCCIWSGACSRLGPLVSPCCGEVAPPTFLGFAISAFTVLRISASLALSPVGPPDVRCMVSGRKVPLGEQGGIVARGMISLKITLPGERIAC